MAPYSWTLDTEATSTAGEGDRDAMVVTVAASGPPGVAPADWIVDILLADGFIDGRAVHRHEGADAWSLDVRKSSPTEG